MKMKKTYAVAFSIILLSLLAVARDDKVASISFVVLKSDTSKPVRNASVVLHGVDKDGHQKKSGMELKTGPDGKASLDAVPYGKWRVQVLAPHFRTYGEDFVISQPTHEITIKLEEPKEQYSIYK
jgi:hypothetical protein